MSNLNKRLLLILAIICIFLIIPCSFAGDLENDTLSDNVLTDDVMADNVADENSIYVSGDGDDAIADGSADKPYQSISKAVENYDSSVNSNIFVKNGTYVFDGTVNINKAIAIVGESRDNVIFDGNNTSGFFSFDSKSALLSDISFVNGFTGGSSNSPGVVHTQWNLIVDNCIFRNNNASAVSIDGGFSDSDYSTSKVQIKNSQFINNTKLGWAGHGGAIYANTMYYVLNATNCQFINNTASEYGGAIYMNSGRKQSFIDGCVFIGNNASEGSAINSGNSADFTVTHCDFINNTASVENSAVIVLDSYWMKTLTVGYNTFINNDPEREFDANNFDIVYIDKNDRLSGEDIDMNLGEDVSFTVTLTDSAKNPISGKLITVNLVDALFKRTTTYTAVTNNEGQAIIPLINQSAGTYTVKSIFEGDGEYDALTATNSIKIKSDHSYNIVFNETIVKAKAGESYKVSGIVTNEYLSWAVLAFSTYNVKWTTHSGGTRYSENYPINSGRFTVDVLDFDLSTQNEYYYINFTSTNENGAVAYGTLIIDTSIPLPPVDENREVIYVAKDGSDEFGDGSEENPLATPQTAFYVNEMYGGNKTIFVKEGVYDISNYEIYANVTVVGEKGKTIFRQGTGEEGMLYLDNWVTTDFTNITFIDGYRSPGVIYGGAVIVVQYSGSIAHFTGCEFYNNSGSSDGMMYVAHGGIVYIDNCIFVNNSGKSFNPSGAILVLEGYLSVNNSYFADNFGAEGGAIFVAGDEAVAFIENTEFRENKAYNDSYAISGGGAIYVNCYNVHINNCSFIENFADLNGGAIYILTGKVEIDKCYFENNRVKEAGNSKGTAIASDSGYTVLLYVTNSVLISDDYSKLISIVNDMAEENEIILNGNYWGNSVQSGVREYAVIKSTTSGDEIAVGDMVEVTVMFVSNSGEELEFSLHDYSLDVSASLGDVDKDSITIVDNVAKFNYYAKTSGMEVITFSHGRNANTLKFNVNESSVMKKDLNANVSINHNKTGITVQVPEDIANNITIILDGVEYSIKAENGVATMPINVAPGNHEVRVSYGGDENYKASISDVVPFTVDKYDLNLAVSVNGVVVGEDLFAQVTTNNNFNGNVIVTVNNKKYTVRITNGSGNVKLNDLAPGIYTAYAAFAGDDYFVEDSSNDTFEVSESLIDVIYVTPDGNDVTGDGSESAPYASISKALERNKRLGGGKTIIISEGNYVLSRFAIANNVTIKANGNVIVSAANNKNHLFIGGNVNVTIEGVTFINGIGVDAGSIEMGSDDAGNVGKALTIIKCNFINNTGAVGAIASYAKTTIISSTFINNTATGKDGFNQGIISIRDNIAEIEYSIFVDNNYANDIVVASVPSSANNNFWGTNDKASDVSANVEIISWIAAVPSIAEDIRTKTNYDLKVEFKQTSDGVNFQEITGTMPDFAVDLAAEIGLINQTTVTISNNVATVNYNVTKKGFELITVDLEGKTLSDLKFHIDVPEYDKIYVSPTGDNSNNGSRDNPVLTIEYAIAQNKAAGGSKTIVILPGSYKEHNLVIDDEVTIIGDDASIDGEGNAIFIISADAEMHNLTLTNANCAINLKDSELDLYGFNFTDSTNVIVSEGSLMIENSQFTRNTGNVINATSLFAISGCEFSQNLGENIILGSSATFILKESKFINNKVNEVIYLDNCFGDINDNVFDSSEVALTAVHAVLEIANNNFNGALIDLSSSTVDLQSNNNTDVTSSNSTIVNVIITFLNGETVIADSGIIQLNATVTDDMLNPITGGNVTFTANGNVIGQASPIDGVAILNVPFTKGNYTISGSFDNNSVETVYDGLLRIDVDYYWFIGEEKYETLAQAVAAAKWGDVIKGVPGTYIIPKQAIGHRYFEAEPWEDLKSVTITSLNETPVILITPNDQMFFVDIGSELTLKNIVVANSGSSRDDGTIETMYDCNLTVINCTFVNNVGNNGGAIYAGGNLVIRDSVFDNNKAALAGAVEIAYLYYTTGQITIENVNFTNNRASMAGAVYCGASDVDMVNVNFINNTANIGGALFVRGGVTRVSNAQFISNNVVNTESFAVSRGGAVHNMLGDLYFENTKFINNSAEGIGGALELENGQYGDIYWTTFDNCEFINNSAYSGGAMYLGEEYDPYVRISNSKFEANVAETDGAAIYDNCAHVTIEKTNFTNNKASGLDVIHVIGEFISGEGLYEDEYYYAQLTIEDSYFANDEADYVIFSNVYGIVDIRNTVFDNESMLIFNRGEATFIKNTVTNSKDAVIENFGQLSLNSNVFDTPILNKKDIMTTAYIVVLDNETKYAAIGENYVLVAVITDDNGNIIDMDGVIFVVDNVDIEALYSDAKFTANYTVTAGTHFVTAKFDSDDLKELKLKTGLLVAKPAAEIEFNIDSAIVGENSTITVTIDPQATGNITVTVNNGTYVAEIKDGAAIITLPGLAAGDYEVVFTYSGDKNFAPSTQTKVFTVSKVDNYKFEVDVANEGIKTVIITIALPDDVDGNLTVDIDGDIQVIPVKDGKANLTCSGLSVGNHNLNVTYPGNDKYVGMSKSTEFKVAKIDSFVKIVVADIILGDDAVINIIVPDDATGDIILTVGKDYLIPINNGRASYTLPDLPLGTYTVNVTYNGDSKYLDSSNSTSFKVIKSITGSQITLIGIKEDVLVGVLKDDEGNVLSGQNITYVINNVSDVVVTNATGEFTISVVSNAKVDILFAGNDEFKPCNASFTFDNVKPSEDGKLGVNIALNSVEFTCYAIDYSAGERGPWYKVTLTDSNGNVLSNATVYFNIAGKTYEATSDKNGVAKIRIQKFKATTHTGTVMYLGDAKHNATFMSIKIKVNKKPLKITAKKKTFKAKTKTKKYTITVKTIKGSSANGKAYLKAGKKFTLKIKGKTYKAKTNKKGKVTFKIKKLTKKGKYTAVIKYKGDSIYKAITKKVKITVKK